MVLISKLKVTVRSVPRGPFLESPDIFSGPDSYFMCAMFAVDSNLVGFESWAIKFEDDKTSWADIRAKDYDNVLQILNSVKI